MYKYIAIEGNIGAGKTTLANLLAKHYNARLIEEQFVGNSFLPLFYENPAQYALPLELSFLECRFQQLKDIFIDKLDTDQLIISDYSFIKTRLFAQVNLNKPEYELFEKFYNITNPQLPQPDLLIYLDAPIARLKENIGKRGRSYEQSISTEYLSKLQNIYRSYLKKETIKHLRVDAINTDFANQPAHLQQLIDFLNNMPDLTTHVWQPQ